MSIIDENEVREKVSLIAPALRVFLDKDGKLAIIRWQPEILPDALRVDIGSDPKQMIKVLREQLECRSDVSAVSIESVGTFVAENSVWNGRLAGKVAFVTGAAQGFGAGITEGLVKEGAIVIVADLNIQGAETTARRINESVGAERCVGQAVNVTDSDSVAEAIYQTVRRFGGIDLVISNAGVLKAGSVKTQPLTDFEFVTRVNYMGYFLVVKHAAPVMANQHSADPSIWTDVIQINSKSGLEGSNKNGAYAGSKFGGIGLTQSFALELIEDGIKVNSVCPGNFFDGPLWSDPENGLFAQYLRAGKVPGATTTDDVRHFYEAKVPMGRGCTVPDVLKAIYYLVDQQYETGQALPVTGGQVMLN